MHAAHCGAGIPKCICETGRLWRLWHWTGCRHSTKAKVKVAFHSRSPLTTHCVLVIHSTAASIHPLMAFISCTAAKDWSVSQHAVGERQDTASDRQPGCHRANTYKHIHTYGRLRVSRTPNLHVFALWEETAEPGGITDMRRTQKRHSKRPQVSLDVMH